MSRLLTILGGGDDFSPLSLGAVELWLDAKDANTITYEDFNTYINATGTSGTNSLTATEDITDIFTPDTILKISGDEYVVQSATGTTITTTTNLTSNYTAQRIYRPSVSSWNDKSSNNNNASQPAQYSQPATLHSNNMMRFIGNDVISTFASNIVGNPDFTIFIVNKLYNTSAVDYAGWLNWGGTGSGEGVFMGQGINVDNKYCIGFMSSAQQGGSLDTNTNIVCWVRDSANGTNDGQTGNILYKNGTEQTLINAMGAQAVNILSGEYKIGKTLNGNIPHDMGEMIIYNKKLSNAERLKVEQYLHNKWII